MHKKKTINSIDSIMKRYSISIEQLDKNNIILFKEKMKKINDPRQQSKTSFKIWDIIVTAFISVLANQNSWDEIHDFVEKKYSFFRQFLKMTGGIPSSKTYERVFSIINSHDLEDICVTFTKDVLKLFNSKKDILSFDGKVDKAISRNENEIRKSIKALNVLNVYSDNYKMCIASEMIEDKTNEITTIPTILKRINAQNSIITWDALNTAYSISSEKANSSIITYEYFQTEDIKWYHDYKAWKNLHTIGLIKKTINHNGKISIEKRFYISSLFTNILEFSRAIRNHWNVENKLHWQLDYTFLSDKNTTMNKKALFNLQIIKKISLALVKDSQRIYGKSLSRIRNIMSFNFEEEILRFFNIISK